MAEENPLIGLIGELEEVAKEKGEKAKKIEEEAKKASEIASRAGRAVGQIVSQMLRAYQGSQQRLMEGYNSINPLVELANLLAEYDKENAKRVLDLASRYKSQIEKDFGSSADTEYALTSWWLTRQLNELQQTRKAVTDMRNTFDNIYKQISEKLSSNKKN